MTYEGASLLHFGHSGTKPSLMMTKTDKFRQDRTQKTCQAVLLTAISLLPESNEEDDLVVIGRKRDCGGKDVQMQVNHER